TADFGYFPIPGKTADKPGSVFLGGSNLAIAEPPSTRSPRRRPPPPPPRAAAVTPPRCATSGRRSSTP
ncbi:hypothetical protein ABZT27_34800, partial [Streptomyces sp. NPDC005389]|uniref:hypothetical protein n=1 Tax=Streptomyces sp. NPDC005389 TaxID=3157040 RepID=UPI0033A71008